jgi:hypothetical protein
MKTLSIQFAERTYTVNQLPIKASRDWRKQFEEPLFALLGTVKGFGDLSKKEYPSGRELLRDVGSFVLANVEEVSRVLLSSTDMVLEALFAYSPELAKDRKYIEANAFDDEAVSAFIKVLGLAYPFGQLLTLLTALSKAEGSLPIGTQPGGTLQS